MFTGLQDFWIVGADTIILLVRDVHSFKVLPEVTMSGKDLVHSATEFVWYFPVFFVGFGIGSLTTIEGVAPLEALAVVVAVRSLALSSTSESL